MTSRRGAEAPVTSFTTFFKCWFENRPDSFLLAARSPVDPLWWRPRVLPPVCPGVHSSALPSLRLSPTWATSSRRPTLSHWARPRQSNRKTGVPPNTQTQWPQQLRPHKRQQQHKTVVASILSFTAAMSHPFVNCIRARPVPATTVIWAFLHRWESSVTETTVVRIRLRPRIRTPKIRRQLIITQRRRPLAATATVATVATLRHPRQRTTFHRRRSWTRTDVSCGTFYNSCSTTVVRGTPATSRGRTRRLASSRSLIPQDWLNFGAFRRTIFQWTTTRCPELYDITTESTFYAKFKEKDTVISKYSFTSLSKKTIRKSRQT